MKLHPAYKETAREISESEKEFFSWDEISSMLRVEKDTIEFQLERMKLKTHALDEYDIDLIPTANEFKGRGYKKATDEERVKITARRLDVRVRNSVRKQRKVLTTVNPNMLTDGVRKLFNQRLIKNGLIISFLHKTPLKKCVSGAAVSVGTPKLIETK